jgi:hypothetical protein
MVRIEAELREEREAVHRERDKVRAAEDAISDEANAAEASQLAHLAERRDAVCTPPRVCVCVCEPSLVVEACNASAKAPT